MANDKQTNFDYCFSTPERAAAFISDLMQLVMLYHTDDNSNRMWEQLDYILDFNPNGFFTMPILKWMNLEKDSGPKYAYTKYGRFEIKDNDKDNDNDKSNM